MSSDLVVLLHDLSLIEYRLHPFQEMVIPYPFGIALHESYRYHEVEDVGE